MDIRLLSLIDRHAAQTGNLKLDVLGEDGAGAKNAAHVIAANGKEAGQVTAGSSIALAPGEYKVVLPIVGGQIVKDGVQIEAGTYSYRDDRKRRGAAGQRQG